MTCSDTNYTDAYVSYAAYVTLSFFAYALNDWVFLEPVA